MAAARTADHRSPHSVERSRRQVLHQPFACCCSNPCGLLFVFLNGALRLHAAHRAYVANIHETVCDGCAFLGVHRPITAGTSNDWKFAQVAYHRWAAPGCSRDPPQQT